MAFSPAFVKQHSSTMIPAANMMGPSESADEDLPSVMTCANYLKLPPYSTKVKNEHIENKIRYLNCMLITLILWSKFTFYLLFSRKLCIRRYFMPSMKGRDLLICHSDEDPGKMPFNLHKYILGWMEAKFG